MTKGMPLDLPDLLTGVPPLPRGVRAGVLQTEGPHDIAVRAHLNAAYKKPPKESPEVRAERFIKQHPEVWQNFVRFCEEARKAGHTRMGVDVVFGRMRWETMMKTKDEEGYKMNNDYKAPFARKLMKERPEFDGFFVTRSHGEE